MSITEPNGRAAISMSDGLMQYAPVKIEHPKAGEIRWGVMEVKELFDTFQSFLLLPDEYRIVGVFYEPMFQMYVVIIESTAILLPPTGEMIPMLYPAFERTAEDKVRLVDLCIPKRWQRYLGEGDDR